MTIVMERGDRDAVGEMLKTRYIQTLAVNYLVWPASQFVNFLIIPSPLQIPFSSTVGVFWNAYLSLKNASRR
jgi:protein Mpv17